MTRGHHLEDPLERCRTFFGHIAFFGENGLREGKNGVFKAVFRAKLLKTGEKTEVFKKGIVGREIVC